MRNTWMFAAILGFVVAAPVARADDKSGITSLFGRLEDGFKNRDTNAVFALCTKDFTETNHGMVVNAQQSRQQIDQMVAMAKSAKDGSFQPSKININGK